MKKRSKMEYTEILDDEFLEQVSVGKANSKKRSYSFLKKNLGKVKFGMFILFLVVLLLHSFEMKQVVASIHNASFDVVKDDLYMYSKLEFSEVDLSTIVNVWDYDEDGIDDHTDIMLGARAFVNTKPKYESEYYDGGNPPEGVGVCTDVVISGFLNAGYDLKELVDTDIRIHREAYPHIATVDKNIDYRRVENLQIFFERYATVLDRKSTRLNSSHMA